MITTADTTLIRPESFRLSRAGYPLRRPGSRSIGAPGRTRLLPALRPARSDSAGSTPGGFSSGWALRRYGVCSRHRHPQRRVNASEQPGPRVVPAARNSLPARGGFRIVRLVLFHRTVVHAASVTPDVLAKELGARHARPFAGSVQ